MNIMHYFKQGSYHTIFLGLTAAFSRAVLFFCLPYFLQKLSVAEFGIWDFYQHILTLGSLILSSGASMALTRFYILYADDPHKQKEVVGNACVSVIVLAFMLLSIGTIAVFFLQHHAERIIIVTALTCLFSFFFIVQAYLRVSEKLWLYAFIFCTQSSLATGLTVLGLYYNVGPHALFYAYGLSLILFLPLFFTIVARHNRYSWPLFKEQVRYSIPLLLYNVIYMGFFTIDRLLLKVTSGYELLGLYALLWKFGALYQFFALSLVNAAPIVIFNAHKESNGTEIIRTLITYMCTALIVGGIISIYATTFAIKQWFTSDYLIVIEHVPLFFMFLSTLEVARFMQTGLQLAIKTAYAPLLALLTLGIQALFLVSLRSYGIAGICLGNMCAFVIYALAGYLVSSKIYPHPIIDYKRITVLLIAFIATTQTIKFTCINCGQLVACWLFVIWFAVIDKAQ